MELNSNFDERAIVHAGRQAWAPSPMQGVERRMLDRIGGEVARATTIVRYAPGSHFSAHTHTGGEEFLVLDGVFQDEHGDFPAGTYVRNPPTSSHTPGSEEGCTIFVKLWQFDLQDRHQMRADTRGEASQPLYKPIDGIRTLELYQDDHEHVFMQKWDPNLPVALNAPHGLEVLVVSGSFQFENQQFEEQSWMRLPKGDKVEVIAGEDGCSVWIKKNHLKEPPRAPAV